VFAACAGLVAWRMALGGLDTFSSNDETMVLGVPTWISYAVMVPAFALLALVCLHGGLVRAARAAPPPGSRP
jgi:TRAP-type C4-dicarboxylate transport system permease small subunit